MHYYKRYSWQFMAILICIAAVTFCGMAFADAADNIANVTTENTTADLALFDSITSTLIMVMPCLPVSAQQGVVGVLFILAVIPHIAAWSPWTLDDKTIACKSRSVALLARGWNILTGNYGRAANHPSAEH